MIIQIEDFDLEELPMFSIWETLQMIKNSSLGRKKNCKDVIFYLVHYAEEKGYAEFSLNDLKNFTKHSIEEIKKEIFLLRKSKYIQVDLPLNCIMEKKRFYILKFSDLLISNKKKAFLAQEWQRKTQ